MKPRLWVFRRRERELDEEIAGHFALAVAERMARGATRAEAEAAARREFGSDALVKEVTRSMWRGAWLNAAGREFMLSLRTLRRSPRFSAAAIACVALGIGVTTTIFSALHGILLQPLPYPNADEVVSIRAHSLTGSEHDHPITNQQLELWRGARMLSGVAQWRATQADLTGPEDAPERVMSAEIDPGLFALLGVAPLHGRWFEAHEAVQGSHERVLLGYEVWRRRFGEDPAAVGRVIQLYNKPYRVVGVMPPGFSFPEGAALWTPPYPMNWKPDILAYSGVVGRLAPGRTLHDAQSEIELLNRRLPAGTYEHWRFSVVSLRDHLVGGLRRPVYLFQGAALLVLLIACANVAALLLARGSARRCELEVRAALGASRGRLILHILAECVALATIGALLGIAVAFWGVRLLALSFPDGVPSYIDLSIRAPSLLFASLAALLSAIVFGIAPALRASHARSEQVMRSGVRGNADSIERRRVRNVLIVAEVGLSVVLLTGGILLVRAEAAIRRSLGFRPEGVITVRVPAPAARFRSDEERAVIYRQVERRIAVLPGVAGVSQSGWAAPLDGDATGYWYLDIEGRAPAADDQRPRAAATSVTPDFFRDLGIPVVRGRLHSAGDSSGERMAVVNETFVRRYFAGGEAVGRTFRIDHNDGSLSQPIRIAGVVADFRQERPPAEVIPTLYLDNDLGFVVQTFIIRTSLTDPSVLAPRIREAVREVDPLLVPHGLQTLDHIVARSTWRERLQGSVIGSFALLALLLTIFGMYGVLSYTVAQRSAELGIRLAVGASAGRLVLLVLGQGLRVAAAGIALGAAGAFAFARLLGGVLPGIPALDPATLAAVAVVSLTVSLLAALAPALRAGAVDPLAVIRGG